MTRAEAEAIFTLAGFRFNHVWEIPNAYWGGIPTVIREVEQALLQQGYIDKVKHALAPLKSPWWLFNTLVPTTSAGPALVGLMRIGWRKNVIEIDWEACPVRCVVTNDNVTRSNQMVHAYSTEKAVEYLKVLRMRAQEETA